MAIKILVKTWFVFSLLCAFVITPFTTAENIAQSNLKVKKVSSHNENNNKKNENKTDIQEKLYRQALFFYFQGDQIQALSTLNYAEKHLEKLTYKTRLFKAGLQINQGLQQQAQATLITLAQSQHQAVNTQNNSVEAQELLTVALLALSEQYIEQGNFLSAQQTLAKINHISSQYYEQYQLLNQLAYWPEKPVLITLSMKEHPQKEYGFSPYIMLNEALRHIEKQEYKQAIGLLTQFETSIKRPSKATFWSTLFSWFGEDMQTKYDQDHALEFQALQDYARLLLAQIYVEQQNYDAAFVTLESFPQHSPYTESALFLFALASQQVKHYSMSFNLLALLHEEYPYSTLGWQAIELLAAQVTEQKSLAQGLKMYQEAERFYVIRLQDLARFSQAFAQNRALVDFSTIEQHNSQSLSEPNKVSSSLVNNTSYQPNNIWLQQALTDIELKNYYQQLFALNLLTNQIKFLQQKLIHINDIIALNKRRKANIFQKLQQRHYTKIIASYSQQQKQLAQVLAKAEQQQSALIFANEQEQKWLERIMKSKRYIEHIAPQRDVSEFQERLARVESVLKWQLNTEFPQRFWQHKQQFSQLNKLLNTLNEQQQSVLEISQKHPSLELLITRYQQDKNKRQSLEQQVTQQKIMLNSAIRQKVAIYVAQQKNILQSYLLNTRRSMASILEQMAAQDKKMALKLKNEYSASQQGAK